MRWYFNGQLRGEATNNYTHQPLPIILNLAIGNFGNCLNCNLENSEFPRYFIIDWIKCFKKENQAISLKPERTTLCVGETVKVFASLFGGDAVYEWISSDSSKIKVENADGYVAFTATEKPGFQGAWRSALIEALDTGTYTVSLNVTFPSGYSETKSISYKVISSAPQTPTQVYFVPPQGPDCCYTAEVSEVQGATSYVWDVQHYLNSYTVETIDPLLDECLIRGEYTVTVQAKNACGLSSPISITDNLPEIGCHTRWNMIVIPNPTTGYSTIKFTDTDNFDIEGNLEGRIFIKDNLGYLKRDIPVDSNPVDIDIENLPNGVYRAIYVNDTRVLSTTIVKNDGN